MNQNKQYIGYIDVDRLYFIPQKYWRAHEFCFYLHDLMLGALREYEQSGVHNSVYKAFKKVLEENPELKDLEMLTFLKEKNLIDAYKHHIVSHLTLGLISD